MKKLKVEKAKKLINEGHICIFFRKEDNDIFFRLITEYEDVKPAMCVSDRYADNFKLEKNIFDLFYNDKVGNDGNLVYKEEEENMSDILMQEICFEQINICKSSGKMKNITKLDNGSYLVIQKKILF